jgi:hypothetical protein
LALNSGEWFFRFFILDHFFRHAIHLNKWSKFSRPPLSTCKAAIIALNSAGSSGKFSSGFDMRLTTKNQAMAPYK